MEPDKDHILVVINVQAGNGLANKVYSEYFRFLKKNQLNFFPYQTTGIADQQNIEKLLAHREFNIVSVLGGDGTVNIVINAIGKGRQKLHIIPCGTGNDLTTKLFNFRSVSDHFANVISGKTRSIDVFKCNDRKFLVSFGIGFDGAVCERVEEMRNKRLPKFLAYWAGIFSIIFGYKEVEIEIDGSNKKIFLLSLANNDRFGGGFKIAPNAILDDGLLELVIVKNISVIERLLNLLKLKAGKHLNLPIVEYTRVKEKAIYCHKAVPAHVDGELLYNKNYLIQFDRQIEICG